MKILPLAVICGSLVLNQTAIAEDLLYPKRTYDALYEIKTEKMPTSTIRMGSDGKGLTLSESKSANQSTRSITDFPNKETITLIMSSKMLMRTPMTVNTAPSLKNEDLGKQPGVKKLGAKVIDGHPCHGYESAKQAGSTTQTWIGDDTNFLVYSETTGPSFNSTMSLTSWSDKAPPPDDFKIPTGWKEMSVGK